MEQREICKYCDGEVVKVTNEDIFLEDTTDYICSICGTYQELKMNIEE